MGFKFNIKVVIYCLVAIVILVLLFIAGIYLSYKPIIAYFKYEKAYNSCNEIGEVACSKIMQEVVDLDGNSESAKKAKIYIKYYLPKNLKNPRYIAELYSKGYSEKANKNYAKAIALFEKVLAEDPEDEFAYLQIGNIRFDEEDYKSSINNINKGLKLNKNYYPLYHLLGKNYFALGREHLANKEFSYALNSFEYALANFKMIKEDNGYYYCLSDHIKDTEDFIDYIKRKSTSSNNK